MNTQVAPETYAIATTEQVKALAAAMTLAIPANLSATAGLRWTHSKGLLAKKIQKLLADDGTRNLQEVLREWEFFYNFYFKLNLSLSGLHIPEQRSGLNRLIVVAQEITIDRTLQNCSRAFPTHHLGLGEFYNDLDKETANDRAPTEAYAIWVRDITESEIEPPKDAPSRPDHPAAPEMTLLERLLFELKYHSETGENLDTERVTCCFGTTHISTGDRPVVCWRKNHVHILWQGDQYTNVLMSCSPHWSREIVV